MEYPFVNTNNAKKGRAFDVPLRCMDFYVLTEGREFNFWMSSRCKHTFVEVIDSLSLVHVLMQYVTILLHLLSYLHLCLGIGVLLNVDGFPSYLVELVQLAKIRTCDLHVRKLSMQHDGPFVQRIASPTINNISVDDICVHVRCQLYTSINIFQLLSVLTSELGSYDGLLFYAFKFETIDEFSSLMLSDFHHLTDTGQREKARRVI